MSRFALARLFPARLPARVLMALGLVVLAATALSARAAIAQSEQDLTFMRIGTGPTGGGYFPMGGLIGNAISNPPGSRPCERGGSCGVPGLIAAAVSTNGAVENIDAIRRGDMELALAQADVAYWAYHGTGPYKDKGAVENLRAVAMLYQESFHLVARTDSGIKTVADLKGRRVSLGEEGSGTLIDALLILEAYGLTPKAVKPAYLKPGAAADALLAGEIDAFFFVAGAPVTTISALTADNKAHLVPIDGEPAAKLTKAYPFLVAGEIAAEVYPNQPAVKTIDVGAVLVADAGLSETLVYGITQALWHPNNQNLFRKGHPGGSQMSLETATQGMGIALHAGAANYYFDAGVE